MVEVMRVTGCTAVPVDCGADTRCIEPEAVRRAVTKRTKAILWSRCTGSARPCTAGHCRPAVAWNSEWIVQKPKAAGRAGYNGPACRVEDPPGIFPI